VLDLDPRRRSTGGHEPDLDLRRVRAIPPEMPQVAQPRWWLPDRDLAPAELGAARRPLEDPAAGPALEDDVGRGVARGRVVGRPPGGDSGRPDLERVGGRAVDIEREADRLDHGRRPGGGAVGGAVFEASSEKRVAASPQTRSRYARTASMPSSWSR